MPEDHEHLARTYLADQLGQAAPKTLVKLATFDEHTLEGEGPVTIFSFSASLGGNPPEPFFVVAGQTQPNYYPAWNLTPEEIYTLHLGTRFMLVVEIQQAPLEDLPQTLERDITDQFARIAPGEPITDFAPIAAFRLENQLHAVCRLQVADEQIHVIAGDLPLGINRQTGLPPHVTYRLHLGRIIREEVE